MALQRHAGNCTISSGHGHDHGLLTPRARWHAFRPASSKVESTERYGRGFSNQKMTSSSERHKTSANSGTCRSSGGSTDVNSTAYPDRHVTDEEQGPARVLNVARRDWLLATAGSAALGKGKAPCAQRDVCVLLNGRLRPFCVRRKCISCCS